LQGVTTRRYDIKGPNISNERPNISNERPKQTLERGHAPSNCS